MWSGLFRSVQTVSGMATALTCCYRVRCCCVFADLWLDGCSLSAALMPEKYELWSRLLNQSGRSIAWEVSWPAYTFHRSVTGEKAGADTFNVDLWWQSGGTIAWPGA
jgi:hypothetical protein